MRGEKAISCWLLLTSLRLGCQAANHYCTNDVDMPLKLDESESREQTIIPVFFGESDVGQLTNKTCRWTVERAIGTRADLQLVIQGVPINALTDSASLSSGELKRPTDLRISFGRRNILVTSGMFLVLPISEILPLTVEAKWSPRTESASQVKLKLLVIVPGVPYADILAYNGYCYAVIHCRQVPNIRGNAQMASFTSRAEIHSLVAANKARESMHPYRRPLELRKPVRLGMFYRASDSAVTSLVRYDNGSCGLMPVPKPVDLLGTENLNNSSCLALNVDSSNKASLESSDCDSLMMVLIKFPEIGNSSSSFAGCHFRTVSEILYQNHSAMTMLVSLAIPSDTSLTTPPSGPWVSSTISPSESSSKRVKISIGVTVSVLLAGGLIVLLIVFRGKISKKRYESNSNVKNEETEMLNKQNVSTSVTKKNSESDSSSATLKDEENGQVGDDSPHSAADLAHQASLDANKEANDAIKATCSAIVSEHSGAISEKNSSPIQMRKSESQSGQPATPVQRDSFVGFDDVFLSLAPSSDRELPNQHESERERPSYQTDQISASNATDNSASNYAECADYSKNQTESWISDDKFYSCQEYIQL